MNALLTLALLVPIPAAPVPKQQRLQWKLAKGDVFYVKTTTVTNATVSLMGNENKQEQKAATFSRYAVIDVSEKGYVIEQAIEKMENGAGGLNGNEAGELLKDVRLTYETDNRFEIKKIKGLDTMIDKISKGNAAVKMQLKQMLNEESLNMGFAEIFDPGPDKAVNVGDRWTRKTKFSLGPLGAFELDKDYKFLSADAGDKVSYTAKAKYVPATEDSPFKITEGEFKAEEWEGEYSFDSVAGRLKSSKTSMKLNGDITIGTGGQNIKMVMVMDVKMETTVSDKSLNQERMK